jgi:hypothetical protein
MKKRLPKVEWRTYTPKRKRRVAKAERPICEKCGSQREWDSYIGWVCRKCHPRLGKKRAKKAAAPGSAPVTREFGPRRATGIIQGHRRAKRRGARH